MNLTIKWDKMGPEFSYSVWYAKDVEGPWIKHNTTRLTDESIDYNNNIQSGYYETKEYNEYTISGLEEETKYCVKVTCLDRYYQWWYSFDGPDSISGGLSAPHTRPSPNGGNKVSFQFNVTGA